MEKRLPLALFLSFLILFAWSSLQRGKDAGPAPGTGSEPEGEIAPASTALPAPPAPASDAPAAAASAADPVAPALAADERWREWLEIGERGEPGHYFALFDNRGASLSGLRIAGFVDEEGLSEEQQRDPEYWTTLLSEVVTETAAGPRSATSMALATLPSSRELVTTPLEEALWQHELVRDEGGVLRGVRFRYEPGTGVAFEHTIAGRPGEYALDVSLSLSSSDHAHAGVKHFRYTPGACILTSGGDKYYAEPGAVAAWRKATGAELGFFEKKRVYAIGKPGEKSGSMKATGHVSFAGVHSKYFAVLLHEALPEQSTIHGVTWRRVWDSDWVRQNPGDARDGYRHVVADIELRLRVPGPGEGDLRYDYSIYAGPKDRRTLVENHPDHGRLVEADLGFFDGIASLLLKVLGFFHSITGNWGWAIILLTFSVRAVLFPINRRSQTAMARHATKMKRVQPKLNEVKEKYKGDPKKLQREQARIMQEEGAMPPLGGCLPVFVQIPVFIGLFSALRTNFDLRQAPFHGWITDLSQPDRLLPLDVSLLFFRIEYLNVLPPLMVVLWILQQRMMPKPSDENAARMQRMMMWMPIVMGVFLYSYAAGLSLYMITQSLLGIFEMSVIKRFWPVDEAELPKKKGGGFLARLSEMQEQAQKVQEMQRRKLGSTRPTKARAAGRKKRK